MVEKRPPLRSSVCLMFLTTIAVLPVMIWHMNKTGYLQYSKMFNDTTQQVEQVPLLNLKAGQYEIVNCSDRIPKTNYIYPVTIVTSFFRIPKSKHPDEQYGPWIKSFLGNVTVTPMVIYASANAIDFLVKRNGNQTGPKIFVVCENQWSTEYIKRPVPTIRNSSVQYSTWESAYKEQQFLKETDNRYVADHYGIYNQKVWHVKEVSIADPFHSDYFLWVDIGSLRSTSVYTHWPSVAKLNCIFNQFQDRIMSIVVDKWDIARANRYQIESGPHDQDSVDAAFFGGTKSAVQWYQRSYQTLHDAFFQAGQFVGREQPIMNALSYKFYEKIIFIPSYNLPGQCGDHWFYFYHFFAETNETSPNCPMTPLMVPHGNFGNISVEEFGKCR